MHPHSSLQSATTLANGGDWQDSLLSATDTNGQKVVPLTPTGARGFFRLRGPGVGRPGRPPRKAECRECHPIAFANRSRGVVSLSLRGQVRKVGN